MIDSKPAVNVTQELLNAIHVTPKLILDPMPAYAEKFQPFAMASSMEVTPKGRLWTCWAGGQDGPNAYLLASCSDDQGKSWRDPVFVIDPQAHGLKALTGKPFETMGTRLGTFWCDPKGRLWLFFHQSAGPDIAQGPDGEIYVHYDRDRTGAAEILFARFREEDVKAGKLVHARAALKNLVKSRKQGMNR